MANAVAAVTTSTATRTTLAPQPASGSGIPSISRTTKATSASTKAAAAATTLALTQSALRICDDRSRLAAGGTDTCMLTPLRDGGARRQSRLNTIAG